jgi:hypothetical protein
MVPSKSVFKDALEATESDGKAGEDMRKNQGFINSGPLYHKERGKSNAKRGNVKANYKCPLLAT